MIIPFTQEIRDMFLDYRWDPASKMWIVVDTRTNQLISSHWTANEAIDLIMRLEVEKDQAA